MKRIILWSVFYFCFQVSFAVAEGTENLSDAVVVTATRTAQTAEESLSSVTVITQEQIENQQATSIQELLRSVAGISIVNNGGEGKNSSLFLRGTNSDHILVLVDGVKIGSATLGRPAFQLIPVEHIERIEVVRGPRSSLYGSEAIGGVVQIFTKKGGGAFRPSVSFSAGSYDSYRGSIGLSGGQKNSWYNFSVSQYETEGFDACETDRCGIVEPDEDGFFQKSASFSYGRKINNKTVVELNGMRANGELEFDSSTQDESETVQEVIGGKVTHDTNEKWRISVLLSQYKDESDDFNDGIFASTFNTKRNAVTVQNDFLLSDENQLIVGLDYQRDEVSGTTDYVVDSRDNKGLFLQFLREADAHSAQLSVRHDDNEQFGKNNTGSLAWGLKIDDGLRLNASYGTAFKAPTFNDLYWPGGGNPDLEPQESDSFEVGLTGIAAWGSWSTNVYHTKIDKLIVYNPPLWIPEEASARIRGIELRLSAKFLGWNSNFDLTIQDPKNNESGANRGNLLPRRPKELARLSFDRKIRNYNFGGILVAEGERYDDTLNTIKLNSYYSIDVFAGYRIDSDWQINASVKNILDEEYQTAAYFNQPGRNYLVTIAYKPSK